MQISKTFDRIVIDNRPDCEHVFHMSENGLNNCILVLGMFLKGAEDNQDKGFLQEAIRQVAFELHELQRGN